LFANAGQFRYNNTELVRSYHLLESGLKIGIE